MILQWQRKLRTLFQGIPKMSRTYLKAASAQARTPGRAKRAALEDSLAENECKFAHRRSISEEKTERNDPTNRLAIPNSFVPDLPAS